MQELAQLAALILDIYFWIMIVRIFLTWIPSISWYKEPFKTMAVISDAYLDIFRKFIPPAGGIDFSPIVALLVYQVVAMLVVHSLAMI